MIWRSTPLLLLLVLCVGLVPVVQTQVDGRLGRFRVQEESLLLSSPDSVRRLSAGFESIMADIYWLRTVQYFGSAAPSMAAARDFALLKPLVDITTALDPELEIAYRYGAIFLCEAPPIGAGRCEEGVALLEAGAIAMPSNWRVLVDKALFLFMFLGDADGAVVELRRASRRPGAPFWLEMTAADIMADGGQRDIARQMWQRLYDTSEIGLVRANAQSRLVRYENLDTVEQVSAAVHRFQVERGRLPVDLAELRVEGFWKGRLADTEGIPFAYDPESGRVGISTSSPMWRNERRAVAGGAS